MPPKGERKQVGYQNKEPSFPYQAVILSNNQVEVILEWQCGWGVWSSRFVKVAPPDVE